MREGRFNFFISHASNNSADVRRIAESLRERGLSIWLDVDSLKPGDVWADKTFDAITESDAFVLFVSPRQKNSPSQLMELGAALIRSHQEKFPLLPVLLPGATVADVPGPLKRFLPISEPTPELVADRIQEALAGTPVAAG